MKAIRDRCISGGHDNGIQNLRGTRGRTRAVDVRRALSARDLLSRRVNYVIELNFFTLIRPRAMTATTLHYSGHLYLRHRLVLSVLSGKPIKIDKIRPGDKNPGLRGMLSQM